MRYRTKLYISFIAIAVLSVIPALTILYVQLKTVFLNEIRGKVLSVAATTAAYLDGSVGAERLEVVDRTGSMKSAEYRWLYDLFMHVRNLNRRDDIYVKFLYTFYIDRDDPTVVRYGVDADEDPDPPGTPYPQATTDGTRLNMHTAYAFKSFYTDQWGTFLSAQAPVHTANGEYIGVVGADIEASSVIAVFHGLLLVIVVAGAAALLLSLLAAFFFSSGMTRSLAEISFVVARIGEGDLSGHIELATHDELEELGESINEMAEGLQERERLKTNFARYVSRHILERILKSEKPIKLEGERRRVTLLFADIRQFTTLSEKLNAEEVVLLLNQFFEKMLSAIFAHSGTFDKFLGDGLMAEFGAPLEDERQADHALEAALEMQSELEMLNVQWQKMGKQPLRMGIGVHTGEAIVGNIGSEKRLDYTAVGDTVNVAEGLQRLTKVKDVSILLSGSTFAASTKGAFLVENLGKTTISDRMGEIEIYTLAKGSEKVRA